MGYNMDKEGYYRTRCYILAILISYVNSEGNNSDIFNTIPPPFLGVVTQIFMLYAKL